MGIFDIFRISKIKEELNQANRKLEEIHYADYQQVQELISKKNDELKHINVDISESNQMIENLRCEITTLKDQNDKLEKQINSNTKKLGKVKELYKSVQYSVDNYTNSSVNNIDTDELDELVPSVILKLHCMDVRDLRKAYKDNEKNIDLLLNSYSSRYTTKANQTIYKLMVIALRAELQNILYNLKYEKLDVANNQVKTVCEKYLAIASEGNQSIASTLTKFIGQLEYLFINAVKIEYNYYVKREQARQEQLAIREQMRQEAQERKELEVEKKKIEKEENKYKLEIEKLREMLKISNEESIEELNSKILELESQLADVVVKKNEITNLQNGKAGYVYVISNLGSFGENVFKIGMTRRMNPQDRVDELGSASVPFRFDVHSFIFSQDAVALESKLHTILNDKRVNKVNLRKEFFYASLEELENLVNEIDTTAEFNKTMLAEEFRQSQSSDYVYTSDYVPEYDEEDE